MSALLPFDPVTCGIHREGQKISQSLGAFRAGYRNDLILGLQGAVAARQCHHIVADDGGDDAVLGQIQILDVRERAETQVGMISGAVNIPLGELAGRVSELDPAKLIVTHCKGGYRSSIATSILRRAGLRDIANLTGGFDAWMAAGLPSTTPAGA